MRRIPYGRMALALALPVLALTGCGKATPPEPPLTRADLKSADLQTDYVSGGVVRLTDGEYREPAAPGSAAEAVITLTEHIAYAPLVTGQQAAAAIVATQTGGSGTFIDLVVIVRQNGHPTQLAATHLGDRVKVRSIAFDKGIVRLEMLVHGPGDPLCCPTQLVTRRYERRLDGLVQLPT